MSYSKYVRVNNILLNSYGNDATVMPRAQELLNVMSERTRTSNSILLHMSKFRETNIPLESLDIIKATMPNLKLLFNRDISRKWKVYRVSILDKFNKVFVKYSKKSFHTSEKRKEAAFAAIAIFAFKCLWHEIGHYIKYNSISPLIKDVFFKSIEDPSFCKWYKNYRAWQLITHHCEDRAGVFPEQEEFEDFYEDPLPYDDMIHEDHLFRWDYRSTVNDIQHCLNKKDLNTDCDTFFSEGYLKIFRNNCKSYLEDLMANEVDLSIDDIDRSQWFSDSSSFEPKNVGSKYLTTKVRKQTDIRKPDKLQYLRSKVIVDTVNVRDCLIADIHSYFFMKEMNTKLNRMLKNSERSALLNYNLVNKVLNLKPSLTKYMVDCRKFGLTIPFELTDIVLETLIELTGDPVFEHYYDIHRDYIYYDKYEKVWKKPVRGRGLGHSVQLDDIIHTVIAMNSGVDFVNFNDDIVYWSDQKDLLTDLVDNYQYHGVIPNYKKSFASRGSQFLELYRNFGPGYDKYCSLAVTIGMSLLYETHFEAKRVINSINASNTNAGNLVMLAMQWHRQRRSFEFHPDEDFLPFRFGGWVENRNNELNYSLVMIDEMPEHLNGIVEYLLNYNLDALTDLKLRVSEERENPFKNNHNWSVKYKYMEDYYKTIDSQLSKEHIDKIINEAVNVKGLYNEKRNIRIARFRALEKHRWNVFQTAKARKGSMSKLTLLQKVHKKLLWTLGDNIAIPLSMISYEKGKLGRMTFAPKIQEFDFLKSQTSGLFFSLRGRLSTLSKLGHEIESDFGLDKSFPTLSELIPTFIKGGLPQGRPRKINRDYINSNKGVLSYFSSNMSYVASDLACRLNCTPQNLKLKVSLEYSSLRSFTMENLIQEAGNNVLFVSHYPLIVNDSIYDKFRALHQNSPRRAYTFLKYYLEDDVESREMHYIKWISVRKKQNQKITKLKGEALFWKEFQESYLEQNDNSSVLESDEEGELIFASDDEYNSYEDLDEYWSDTSAYKSSNNVTSEEDFDVIVLD